MSDRKLMDHKDTAVRRSPLALPAAEEAGIEYSELDMQTGSVIEWPADGGIGTVLREAGVAVFCFFAEWSTSSFFLFREDEAV